jgi:hypothetical protein
VCWLLMTALMMCLLSGMRVLMGRPSRVVVSNKSSLRYHVTKHRRQIGQSMQQQRRQKHTALVSMTDIPLEGI